MVDELKVMSIAVVAVVDFPSVAILVMLVEVVILTILVDFSGRFFFGRPMEQMTQGLGAGKSLKVFVDENTQNIRAFQCSPLASVASKSLDM